MSTEQANPVTRRLDVLREYWTAFRENELARVLRWRVDADTTKLVETFFATEADEGGEDESLIILFEQPFEDPDSFGRTLVNDMLEAMADEADGIAEDGFDADWKPPADTGERDAAYFGRCLASLSKFYEEDCEAVCAIITPEAIDDSEAWALWLGELSRSGLPSEARVSVIDPSENPRLDRLCELEPDKIVTESPVIDSNEMVREIAFSSPGAGPGFGYRRHMVSMLTGINTNPAAAMASGVQAKAIAAEHGWKSLVAFIGFASAGQKINEGKPEEAAAEYRAAGDEAQEGDEPQELKDKLLLQSRMSEGSAFISGKMWTDAARCFTEAAPIAADMDDKPAQIQCLQLAGFCHEQDKERELAWERGTEALDVGETVEPDDREQTVLPYAALGLLRLCDKRPFKKLRGDVQKRADKLLGEDWEEKVEQPPDEKKGGKKGKGDGS